MTKAILLLEKGIYLLLVVVLIIILSRCSNQQDKRPKNALLLDNAKLLVDITDTVEKQLEHIRNDYGIEVVLSTDKTVGPDETIKEKTARLFTQWNIGRDYGGKGLFLYLADNEKEVRIEVGLALEGVFTDLFTGHIENKQLKSYYLSGQLEIGLIAVLEEIEARASLLAQGGASEESIHDMDMAFLSAGGGADVELRKYKQQKITKANDKYPAGKTPDEAWQTLIRSWREKNRDPNIEIYTPITRLIYRAFTSQPDHRFEEDVRTWANKPYEVISNENYAVIFFGKKKGWDNAPFLFCRTKEGWQFDMVHQRKIVRMGRAPHWGIERGEHPYIRLLARCPYWMGQDIPRRDRDLYQVKKDSQTAADIINLEKELMEFPDDFEILLELGHLYTLTSMSQQRFALLNKANTIQPNHPEVIKNLAIAHVDAHYQYKKARALMQNYIMLRPNDPFGYFYLGYLLLMEKQPDKAIDILEKGLSIEPTNIYGLCKLARAYVAREGMGDKDRAEKILTEVKTLQPLNIRTKWLTRFVTDKH